MLEWSEEDSESESVSLSWCVLAVWKESSLGLVVGLLASVCLSGGVHQRCSRDLVKSCCWQSAASMQSCRMGRVATYVVIVSCRTLI
jgi:hypothetical protein